MDSRGIEPRTTPMLREYYTTKPQAQFDERGQQSLSYEPEQVKELALRKENRQPWSHQTSWFDSTWAVILPQ